MVRVTLESNVEYNGVRDKRLIESFIPLDEQGNNQDDDVVCYFGVLLSSRIHICIF